MMPSISQTFFQTPGAPETVILAQIPGDPTKFVEYLKYGQLGAALAMLILGFYLHWQASHSKTQINQRQGVARQFMLFALAFFTICSLGELAKSLLPERDRLVNASIAVPPLDEINGGDYGNIHISWRQGDQKGRLPAITDGQIFQVREGTAFTINLNSLITKLSRIKETKEIVESALIKDIPELGPGAPQ